MRASWQEEFEKKYNKPQVERVTVGFSGIDPQQKISSADIDAEIWKKLTELEIRIDSGSIDPDTPEPSPSPSTPTITNHERLAGLLGGNDDGHYHLTDEELHKLQDMPSEGVIGHDGKAATIRIGSVTTGEAGSTAKVTNTGTETDVILNFTIPQGAKGDTGARGADGSQGPQGIQGVQGAQGNDGKSATVRVGSVITGAAGTSASVTNSGTTTDAVLNFIIPKGDKGNNGTDGQDGKSATVRVGTVTTGEAGTTAKVTNSGTSTDAVLDFVIPKGDKGYDGADATASDIKHEELPDLQGGKDDEHYHMEEEQHRRLGILIKALFPTDTDEIYIPYIDDRDPDHPIVLPYTPFEDLPKGHPPEWKIVRLPTNYIAHETIDKMYYGDFPHSSCNSGLFVLLKNSGTGKHFLYNTKDLMTWTSIADYASIGTSYRGISYIGDGYINSTVKTGIIYLTTTKYAYAPCGWNTTSLNASYTGTKLNANSTVLATAVSPEMGILLVAGNDSSAGIVNKKLKRSTSGFTVSTNLGTSFTVNVRGLAWSPEAQLFCLCGAQGIATSADGENWTKRTGSDIPKNLTDLTYREDLGCLFARSIDEKIFYASGDGIEWVAVTTTPIPLDTVACVDYAPSTGIYCAVGGTGRYAYFSKDLKTWAATTITNGAEIEAGSVIYMQSTGLYVLMPTSGSYYYTFDPSAWTD